MLHCVTKLSKTLKKYDRKADKRCKEKGRMSIENIKYNAKYKKPRYIPDELYKAIQEKYGCTPNEYYAYYYGGIDITDEDTDLTGYAKQYFSYNDETGTRGGETVSYKNKIEEIYNDEVQLNEAKAYLVKQLKNDFMKKVKKAHSLYEQECYKIYDNDNDSNTTPDGKYQKKITELFVNYYLGFIKIVGDGTVEVDGVQLNAESTLDDFVYQENSDQMVENDIVPVKNYYNNDNINITTGTIIAYAAAQHQAAFLSACQGFSEDDWKNTLLPKYLNNQISKAYNLTRYNDVTDRPDYSEWNIYSYEEILAMRANGTDVPEDLLSWAKSMENAHTTNFEQEGESAKDTSTTDDRSLKDIEKKTKQLNEETKKAKKTTEKNFENLKLVADSTQRLKDEKEDKISKSLEEMNNLNKEYKDLSQKQKNDKLTRHEKKRFKELQKLLDTDGVLNMNLKAASNELEELIRSIDNIDLEINANIELGNETIEMADKLSNYANTDNTADDTVVTDQPETNGDLNEFQVTAQSGDLAEIATENAESLVNYSNELDETISNDEYTNLYNFASLTVNSYEDYVSGQDKTSGETKNVENSTENKDELSKAEKFLQGLEGKTLIEKAYALLKQDAEEVANVIKSQIKLDLMGIESEAREKASTEKTKFVEKQTNSLKKEKEELTAKQKQNPQDFSEKDGKRLEKIEEKLNSIGEKSYEFVSESLEKVNEYDKTLDKGELRGDDAIDFGEITADISAELIKYSLALSLGGTMPLLGIKAIALSASTAVFGGQMILAGKIDNKLHDTVDKNNDSNINDITEDKKKLENITDVNNKENNQKDKTNAENNSTKTTGSSASAGSGDEEEYNVPMLVALAIATGGAGILPFIPILITKTVKDNKESKQIEQENKEKTANLNMQTSMTQMEINKDKRKIQKLEKDAKKITKETQKLIAEFKIMQQQNDEIGKRQEEEANMNPQETQEESPQFIVDEDGNIVQAPSKNEGKLTVKNSSAQQDTDTLANNSMKMGTISGKLKTYNGKLSKYSTQIARLSKKNETRSKRCQKLALERRQTVNEQQKYEEDKAKRLNKRLAVVGIFNTVFSVVSAVAAVLMAIPFTSGVGQFMAQCCAIGIGLCGVTKGAIQMANGDLMGGLLNMGIAIVQAVLSFVGAGQAGEAIGKAANIALTAVSSAAQTVQAGTEMASNIQILEGEEQSSTLNTISQVAGLVSAAASIGASIANAVGGAGKVGEAAGDAAEAVGDAAEAGGAAASGAVNAAAEAGGAAAKTATIFTNEVGEKTLQSVASGIGQVAGWVGQSISLATQMSTMIKAANGNTDTEFEDIMNIIGTSLATIGAISSTIGGWNNNQNGWAKTSDIFNAIGSTVSSSAQISMMIKQFSGNSDMEAEEIMALIGVGFSLAGAMASVGGSVFSDEAKADRKARKEERAERKAQSKTKPENEKTEKTNQTENTKEEKTNENKAEDDINNSQAIAMAATANVNQPQPVQQNQNNQTVNTELNETIQEISETANQYEQNAQDEQRRSENAQQTHKENEEKIEQKSTNKRTEENTENEQENNEYKLKQQTKETELNEEAKVLGNKKSEVTDENKTASTEPDKKPSPASDADTQKPSQVGGEVDTSNSSLSIGSLKTEVRAQSVEVEGLGNEIAGLEAEEMNILTNPTMSKEEKESKLKVIKHQKETKQKELHEKQMKLEETKNELKQKRNERIEKINKWINIAQSTASTGEQIANILFALNKSNEMSMEEKSQARKELKLSDSELERLKQARIKYDKARARGIVS